MPGTSIQFSRTEDRERTLQQGMAHARKAIAIDQRDYAAHWALGRLHNAEGDHQSAVQELETSININPNFAQGYYGLSEAHLLAGHPEKTIELLDTAIRLSPNDPLMWAFVGYKGIAYGVLKDFDRATEYLEKSCRFPMAQFVPFAMLAALYAVVGRLADAAKLLDQARRVKPGLSLEHIQEFWRTADQESFEIYFEGLRKAGLTE